MQALLVMPKNINELNAINDFVSKMNIKSKLYDFDNEEDFVFGSLIAEGDNGNYVDESEILSLLSKVS